MKKTTVIELNVIFPKYPLQKVKRIAKSNVFKMPEQKSKKTENCMKDTSGSNSNKLDT